MTSSDTSKVWIPVCCGRVMRYNMFPLPNGGAYAALVCTFCSKTVTLEQESTDKVGSYGEGSGVIGMLGSPKPPKTDRRKSDKPAGTDESTL